MTTETRPTDNAERIRSLTESVRDDLQAEASFDPADWELGDEIPDFVDDRIRDDLPPDNVADAIVTAYDEWQDEEVQTYLDTRAEVDVGRELTVRSVTVVLGTGGPHVEVRFDPDSGRGEVIAYDWFGSDRHTYPVDIGKHGPLMMMAQSVTDRLEGLI